MNIVSTAPASSGAPDSAAHDWAEYEEIVSRLYYLSQNDASAIVREFQGVLGRRATNQELKAVLDACETILRTESWAKDMGDVVRDTIAGKANVFPRHRPPNIIGGEWETIEPDWFYKDEGEKRIAKAVEIYELTAKLMNLDGQ